MEFRPVDPSVNCDQLGRSLSPLTQEQLAQRSKYDHFRSGARHLFMNAQDAQTLRLHETVAWTPDGMKGEIIARDDSGVRIRWEDGQLGYYQFTDLLSQIERYP